jgi:hypothetical protein
VRGIDGLTDSLEQISLRVDDALRSASASGGKEDACGFVRTQMRRPPTRGTLTASTIEVESADIGGDHEHHESASCCQTRHYCNGKLRRNRRKDSDQLTRLGRSGDLLGQAIQQAPELSVGN